MSKVAATATANPARSIGLKFARVICDKCGTNGAAHRFVDGRCPAIESWGMMAADPFKRRDPTSGKPLEGLALSKAIDAFWRAWSSTSFVPMTQTGASPVA